MSGGRARRAARLRLAAGAMSGVDSCSSAATSGRRRGGRRARWSRSGPELAGPAREEIDARGLLVLPGVVDAHVHLNEPGRAEWEGFATGTARAGGRRRRPAHRHAAQRDAADRRRRGLRRQGRGRSGASPRRLRAVGRAGPRRPRRLDELAARGVVGFKAFMSASGIEEFEAADDLTLLEGMARAARLGLPVAVHAESEELTRRLARRAVAEGASACATTWPRGRCVAELEAIGRAIASPPRRAARCTSSTSPAVAASRSSPQARARGVDVTCETCPHYLVLDEDDAERLGAVAKCAPPLRPRRRARGAVGGAARRRRRPRGHRPLAGARGAQAGRRLLRGLGRDRRRPDAAGAALRRGRRGPRPGAGALADLLAAARRALRPGPGQGRARGGRGRRRGAGRSGGHVDGAREELLDRHRLSPFVGRTLRGRVVRTILRGHTSRATGGSVGRPAGAGARAA